MAEFNMPPGATSSGYDEWCGKNDPPPFHTCIWRDCSCSRPMWLDDDSGFCIEHCIESTIWWLQKNCDELYERSRLLGELKIAREALIAQIWEGNYMPTQQELILLGECTCAIAGIKVFTR